MMLWHLSHIEAHPEGESRVNEERDQGAGRLMDEWAKPKRESEREEEEKKVLAYADKLGWSRPK